MINTVGIEFSNVPTEYRQQLLNSLNQYCVVVEKLWLNESVPDGKEQPEITRFEYPFPSLKTLELLGINLQCDYDLETLFPNLNHLKIEIYHLV